MSDTTRQRIPAIIAGTGHGCRVHLPALQAAGFDVVGLVGNDPERTARRAKKTGVPCAFTDLGEAIDATGARAVTVASPPLTHADLVMTAVERGCHVICEKPFARDAEEARQLLTAADRAGVVHMIGNQMRALPERVVIARAIAQGMIGEPRFVTLIQHISLIHAGLNWPEWWTDAGAGGGWLGASGSHMIDQVHSWLGRISTLSASLSVVSERENVAEDSFALRFTLENGAEGIIQQTGAAFGPMAALTRVNGTRGTVWVDEQGAWLADASGRRALEIPDDLRLPEIAPSDDPRKQFLHVELPPTIRFFQAWRDAINGEAETGAPGRPRFATFADGVASMEVIDAVRRSAARGGELTVVS